MPRGKEFINDYLQSDMAQRWILNTYSKHYTDQYGFQISYGKMYLLKYKGREVMKVHSLPAAKMISTIILNDIILNKKIDY